MDRAKRNIAFIEQLHITKGSDAGKRFLLRDWQKRFIEDVYSPVRTDGKRAVRRAILSIGRKNGKTEFAGAIILLHLIGPESEPNGEVYSAANDRQQAAIVFDAVKRMINAEPALAKHLRVVDSTKTIFVQSSNIRAAGSSFKALSAEVTTKLGFSPSCIVYDELAQAKKRDLFDALATSQGARSEPLLMVISTQSNDPQHVLSEMIVAGKGGQDPSTVCHLYAAPEGCHLMDEDGWFAANPALGDFLDLQSFREDAARAVAMPAEESSFRNFRLNQQVSPFSTLISRTDWSACGPSPDDWLTYKEKASFQFDEGEPIYMGLDMSMRVDLTALVMVSAENGSRAKGIYWKPQDVLMAHTDRDRVRYDTYHSQGWLDTTPGRSIVPEFIAQKIAQIHKRNPIVGLAYDRYLIDELLRCFDNIGLRAEETEGDGGLRIVPWGQGYKDMSPAVAALEAAVLNNELSHDGNPLTTFCVMNSQVITDPAGNRKLDKSASRFRIDGAVALAMALGLKARDRMPTGDYESTLFSEGFDYKSLYG